MDSALRALGKSTRYLLGNQPKGSEGMCQKVLGECVGESLGDVPDFRLDAYPEALLYFSLNILG